MSGILVVVFLLVSSVAGMRAAGAAEPEQNGIVGRKLTYEAWAGADATAHSWSVYGGMASSFQSDIRSDGWRLRSAGGYGAYSYTSPRWNGAARTLKNFDGVQSYTVLLLGYQHTLGPWIVKGFIGATQESHAISPFDTENIVQGGKIGVKGALETWLGMGETAFLQTDMSFSDVFQSYGARVRAGYRINPALSTGLEAAAIGNATYDTGRIGPFMRIEWSAAEVSISGGAAGDQSGVTGPYGSFSLMLRF